MLVNKQPSIETLRLRLRQVQPSDIEALLVVNCDEEVNAFLPYPRWADLNDGEAWYQRMVTLQTTGSAIQLVLVDKASNLAIGSCLVFRHDAASQRAELGYVLGREHWRQGLMNEALGAVVTAAFAGQLCGAFLGVALRRLEAEVNPINRASCAALHRLGFTQEGLLRQRWVGKGQAYDVAVFGLLSHEWPQPA